ncbi:alpha/beta fold hydrolase [Nocardioides alcanivorans]|uniref:alpha/beta fold hydrolase n=1 Tax=Nocardioides alcanivorans TaxID=2897352 RepID=UPI001F32B9A0|nr:alpha/beta fold hydrolase [Nocardioides alcanivorans]
MERMISEELRAPVADGIDLAYQTFGDPDGEPLLLVMGLGGPMNWWDSGFCGELADRGFFVIRYDNRDTGHSSRVEQYVSRADLLRAFVGRPAQAPYDIGDLADDGFALLDHLGIGSAHLVGISMGGMIVQTMTLARPDRVRSLTSIMSSTGERRVGWQHPTLLPRLIAKRASDFDAYVESSIMWGGVIGSPGYPETEEKARARARETFERGLNPAGVLRHMMAVLTQPNRTAALASVTAPTLVIHGTSDKMVNVSGGRATAAAVPGSELLLITDMGHNLPVELWPLITRAIRRNADRGAIHR